MVQEINIPDSIFRFIKRFSAWQVWLVAMAVNVGIFLLVGLIVDYYYANTPNYMSFRSYGEIVNGFNVWVIVAPGAWWLYRWLPESIYKLAQQLEANGSIWQGNESNLPKGIVPLSDQLLHAYQQRAIPNASFVLALATLAYYHLFFVPNQNAAMGSQTVFWFVNNAAYLIILVLYFQMAYVGWNTIVRALVISRILDKYFQHPDAIKTLYPLHPDYCSGMGNIGYLVVRFAQIFVVITLCQLIVTLYPVIQGGTPIFGVMLVVNVVYLVMLPLVIILPILRPHQAMMRYKAERLLTYSRQVLKLSNESRRLIEDSKDDITETLQGASPKSPNEELQEIQERIESLVKIHQFLDTELQTWPITFRSARGFSVFATSPILVSALSFFVNFVIQRI